MFVLGEYVDDDKWVAMLRMKKDLIWGYLNRSNFMYVCMYVFKTRYMYKIHATVS